MKRDEAFYYIHQDEELMGAVITHVDYFTLAGTQEVINKVLEAVPQEQTCYYQHLVCLNQTKC